MTITTRKQARENGSARYFTGKACPKGHVAERYAASCVCVQCNQDRGRVTTPHSKLQKRRQNLRGRYGMEIEEFVKRVEEQANRCAICRNLAKKLFVDHCHDKSHVRELLCQRCNSLLGQAEDQIEILQSAIDYLIKHS